MLTESPVIYKDSPLSPAEDYKLLRKEGLALIEQLASARWTDYNTHDPGVTILEALCYAITDLGYRTNFGIKDLLTRSDKGATYSVGQFHTAAEVLSTAPVSFDDLKKVLLDVRGVRNAVIHAVERGWLKEEDCSFAEAAENEANAFTIKGLYEVCLEYEEFVKSLRTGPEDLSGMKPGQGGYIRPEGQGIHFDIGQDVLLKSVSVYPAAGGNVTLRLMSGEIELKTWQTTIPDAFADKKYTLPLDYAFTYHPHCDKLSNSYRLIATDEDGCPLLYAHKEPHYQRYMLEDYVQLTHGSPVEDMYYFFYDWQWDTPESEDTLGKWKRGGVGEEDNTFFAGDYVPADSYAMVFDAVQAFTLESVFIFAKSKNNKGTLSIYLESESGKELWRKSVQINEKICKLRVPICEYISPCQNYRLRAASPDGVELAMNFSGNYPYSIQNEEVVTLVGGTKEDKLELIYPFFYDWKLSWRKKESGEIDDQDLTKGRVRREVWRRLHQFRNLCEDPVAVEEVRTDEIAIRSDIQVAAGTDVNEILAEIYCRLETYIKPPIHFYTLAQMQEKGYPVEVIFDGPLLQHGFIDPAEFQAAKDRTNARASDIINLMIDNKIPGVEKVSKLRLERYRDGVLQAQDAWELCWNKNDICQIPNFSPELSCITFYHRGIVQQPDMREVAALLEEKRLRSRPVRLKGQQQDLSVPIGEDRQLSDYYPMQHELPAVYQAGRFQTPDSQSQLRKAQSKQLKSYLLFFEQILANYLAQLDNMYHLFNWEPKPRIRTYFSQAVTEDIAEVDQLYVEYQSLTQDLDRIAEEPFAALERRNRFLDHLLARFSESFSDYSLLMYGLLGRDEATLEQVIRDKELFLQHYPALSRDRSLGFDYTRAAGKRELSGYEKRVMGLLGMRPAQPLAKVQPQGYQLRYDKSKGWQFVISRPGGTEVWFESRFVETDADAAGLFELALIWGVQPEHYQPITLEDDPCLTERFVLAGPCGVSVYGTSAIGFTTNKDPEQLEKLIAWFESYENPVPLFTPLPQSLPDLGSDYVDIRQEEGGLWYFVLTDDKGREIFRSTRCKTAAMIEQLLDAAILLGSKSTSASEEEAEYQLDTENCRWVLLRHCGDSEEVIGTTSSLESLYLVKQLFRQAAGAEGLHVVEHILLRPTDAGSPSLILPAGTDEDSANILDPYSFVATAFLPAWPERSGSLAFRKLAEETLRREAPAHVYLDIRWLNYTRMRQFEKAWLGWLDASPAGKNEALKGLIHELQCASSVYPPARLYDPAAPGGEAAMLGQMSLKAM